MSSNEKRLLAILGIGGFILINILGFVKIKQFRAQLVADEAKARSEYNMAKLALEMRDQVAGEMDWLSQYEPKPQEEQDVQSALQQLVEREATSRGLTIKSQKLLPTDTNQKHYHRAKVEFKVSGTEENLYKWIGRLQIPSEFRAVTKIRLVPETSDDTRIEAVLTIEQWFVAPTSNI
ncbi:hypothetical protein KBB96_04775 [Luteolibacter ambystomatis]|uniref:Uncharacterized protein n=1 Tax=Luteolibacter ambystomatis TaxID=2824561 RepID=A0A975J1B3_9BACT|nr:hypothetical protein [Luteolibacter ambystomatis]QUE52207.1 hypothetical protein KBB96_04775 [Luteolibacter ambystomatis]